MRFYLSRVAQVTTLSLSDILNQQTEPNEPFQRTRATKRIGVFAFRGVARGAERGRYAGASRRRIGPNERGWIARAKRGLSF